jgi:hypothetical protein
MEKVSDIELPFAPIEYLIVRKLEYFRDTKSDRHLNDVAGLLRVSGKRIDSAKLDALIAERSLASEWEAAQKLGRTARA